MSGLETSDRTLTARFLFPKDFAGFQGHFPGKMILPGVCQIQCALSMIESGIKKVVTLKEVVLAKYFSPLFPDDAMTCVVSDVGDQGEFVVKAVITKSGARISELKLRVLVADRG